MFLWQLRLFSQKLLLHLIDGMNSISGKKDLVQQPEKHVGEEQSMDIDGLSFEEEESIWAKEESMKSLSPISPSRSSQPIDKSGKEATVIYFFFNWKQPCLPFLLTINGEVGFYDRKGLVCFMVVVS